MEVGIDGGSMRVLRCGGGDVWRSGRRVVKVWIAGGVLQVLPRRGVEVWIAGVLKARCRCRALRLEDWSSGGTLEPWRRGVNLGAVVTCSRTDHHKGIGLRPQQGKCAAK